jgi:hypothetical protein
MRKAAKQYFKTIDFILFNEKRIRDAVYAARNDIQRCEVHGSGVGNPTESAAIQNIMPLRSVKVGTSYLGWPEEWLRVVDATRLYCSNDMDMTIVLSDYYGAKEGYSRVCAKLSISANTLSRLKNEIRYQAALCAANLNLIRFI